MWCSKILCVTIVGVLAGIICAQSDDAKIAFLTSSTSQEAYGLTQASEILKNTKFEANRKTVLYIHGYVESLATSTTRTIISAYIQAGTHNLLVLDWSTLAGGSYPGAVANARDVSIA